MRLKRLVAAIVGMLIPMAVLVLYRSVGWARYEGSIAAVPIDITHPDALVRTRSLSQLPRDLLKVPLARDLLTEDLVFYYEEHPDRLGLKGTIRRIAYEHELRWSDDLIAWALDQPAEVALWRADDGRLRYWLVAMSRRDLATVLQEIATVAMKDRQLRLAGKITVLGRSVEVFAFEYSPIRTLLILGSGDRLVVLSDPGVLLGSDGQALSGPESLVAKLLSGDEKQRSVYGDAFHLGASSPEHSILVRAHYLSFGYQHFFPGVQALRFDFGGGWSTHVLFDGGHLAPATLRDRDLWAGVPANPAACALLPVDWLAAQASLDEAPVAAGQKPSVLTTEIEGPGAVCWYASGRLHAPLFTAMLKRPRPDLDPLLEALFTWGVSKGGQEEAAVSARRTAPDQVVWQRSVPVPFVDVNSDGEPEPGTLDVTLARRGRYLFFSPDAKRVEEALATVAKRYPSIVDALPPQAVTLALLSPKGLADMGRQEALVMLPRGAEPVLRGAAERLLLPRLDAMAKYPQYRLALAGAPTASGWQTVEWQEVGR